MYDGNQKNFHTGAFRETTAAYNAHLLSEVFYFEQEINVDTSSGQETLYLNMKRCSAKMTLKAEGLKTGTVRATIRFSDDGFDSNRSVSIDAFPESPEISCVFTLLDAKLCWNNDAYEETYPVDFYYIIGDSSVQFDTRDLTFKRNTATNVIITINNGLNGDEHYISLNFENDYVIGDTESITYTP